MRELSGDDPDLLALGEPPLSLERRRWQVNDPAGVGARLERLGLGVGYPARAIADPHQRKHAEAIIYCPPLFDDAAKEIGCEQRRRCALGPHQGQKRLVAAQAELLGGKALALR